MKKTNYAELQTNSLPLENVPLSEYPRPQMVRDSYLCLNGQWNLNILDSSSLQEDYPLKIIVPFCVESQLSGIKRLVDKNKYLHYRKEFTFKKNFIKDKVLLHFDSIDCYATIYFNQKEVCTHKGGYLPFSVDITPYIKEGTNAIEVVVNDPLDGVYPYGKQKVNRGGMWYTPVTGIWKTVWLESVPKDYIKSFKIETTLSSFSIKVDSESNNKKIIIHHTKEGDIVKEFKDESITIDIPSPQLWSPENPHLYNFDLYTENDKVSSYFALRTITIGNHNEKALFFLNGKPYFFHGLLDQGYYPDGIYTPRSYDEYKRDIVRMKELGFNTLRKHIKIEPLYFYYLCDKLGMIVFQDMVNNSPYSFIHDTLLPTIGITKLNDKKFKVPPINKDIFLLSMKDTVELLYNTPSIVLWTIFNEGWGQFESDRMFNELLSLDSTRLIDATSGWFTNNNPLTSKHIYFRKVKMKYEGKPLYLSEFGGYELSIDGHRFNPDKIFGYKHFHTKDELQAGISFLYNNEIIPLLKEGLCATIYTQVSDVEDETNGLLTYDRKICKVNKEEMLKIASKLKF